MKRVFTILTSIFFLIISQAGLIHAMDMNLVHNDTAMPAIKMFTPKADIFCGKNISSAEASCFQEIPESKWIASGTYRILEVFQFVFFVFFALYSALLLILNNNTYLKVKRILGPPKNSYQTLFGVIRNLN